MRAHKLAPPDPGFAGRLRSLAEAAAREQVAWEHAHTAGLLWRPVPGPRAPEPPYELRAGTGRRGPEELWERFDQAVAALNSAITGSDAAAVADAFGELREAAAERSRMRSSVRTRRPRGARSARAASRRSANEHRAATGPPTTTTGLPPCSRHARTSTCPRPAPSARS